MLSPANVTGGPPPARPSGDCAYVSPLPAAVVAAATGTGAGPGDGAVAGDVGELVGAVAQRGRDERVARGPARRAGHVRLVVQRRLDRHEAVRRLRRVGVGV